MANVHAAYRIFGWLHVSLPAYSHHTDFTYMETFSQSLLDHFDPHLRENGCLCTDFGICGFRSGVDPSNSAINQVRGFRLCILLFLIVRVQTLFSNTKLRTLYGFRMTTLVGWVGGDSYKYVTFQSRLTVIHRRDR